MKISRSNSSFENQRGLWLALVIIGLLAMLAVWPFWFNSKTVEANNSSDNILNQTRSHEKGLENYDIREQKSEEIAQLFNGFRQQAGKNDLAVKTERNKMRVAEDDLRQRVPTLKVEYNTDLLIPEVIGPDVKQGRAFLNDATSMKRSEILRRFLGENNDLIGMTDEQLNQLKVTADYTNPNGDLSFAHLEQFINGVPVFRGEAKAGFTRDGRMIRVINNLAPGLDYSRLNDNFGDAAESVRAAFGYVGRQMKEEDTTRNAAESTDLKVKFGQGDWATTAEKMYFPIEPGVARASWRVLIWESVAAYYVIVDAETGAMLWRKNVVEDQTQSATYNVWRNTTSLLQALDSPNPLTPGPVSPLLGTQGARANRTTIAIIGNEAPYTFNNNGWITDGTNETDGNAVEAGLDRDATNGVDVTNGKAVGSPNRTFNFPANPGDPSVTPTGGEAPIPSGEITTPCASIVQPHGFSDFQKAAVTQLFYLNNRYHDEMYLLGFTEQARNFQNLNFGRGGVEGDRVSAEAQDCSGANNANFGTTADGNRGRMQMYLWTGPNPDFDGTIDADVVVHEHTHGLSNRLHGNASGLSGNMSRGMGEGWSDFYAHALLSEPTDPINGVYTIGGYATYSINTGFTGNYYYGIRRFPKAVIAFTGPNGRPHNGLTFKHLNADCGNDINTISAFPRGPVGSATCDQVHNAGEIWSSALWEVRAKFMARLGAAAGNRKALQLVTDGMKLAPMNPTFLQERDAIIAAGQASNLNAPEAATDVADIWAAFALRGMGFSARVINTSPAEVVEGFDLPNLTQVANLTISDSTGNNNGIPEPGEPILITVPLFNNTGNTVTGVTLQLVGGGSASYGDITNNQNVSRTVNYTVPANTICGDKILLTFNVNSNLGPTSFTKTIWIGQPNFTAFQNFDGVTAPALPGGWATAVTGGGTNWVTTTTTPDSAPNAAFTTDPTTTGYAELVSPAVTINSPVAQIRFRNNFNTEDTWDGGVLEIKIGGGNFQDIISAGGTFVEGGYNNILGPGGNTLANRPAWTGNSNGYITSTVQLPAAANGQSVQFRWIHGSDSNTAVVGWSIDSIQIANSFTCAPVAAQKARADFDGDGKTDVSVYRNDIWYLQQSTAGFGALQWGTAGDTVVSGKWDNDNKEDFAVFRPSSVDNVPDWWVLPTNGTAFGLAWGTTGDIPVENDFDGDGKVDAAVFRPSNNNWYILNSSGGATIYNFGLTGDVPLSFYYDADNKADIAVYRNGVWWIQKSTGGIEVITWGAAGNLPVSADYNNDNIDDLAVYETGTGIWRIRLSGAAGGTRVYAWGQTGDVPVPGDYNGDGADEIAIYRNGTWYINSGASGLTLVQFGLAADTPVPRSYLP